MSHFSNRVKLLACIAALSTCTSNSKVSANSNWLSYLGTTIGGAAVGACAGAIITEYVRDSKGKDEFIKTFKYLKSDGVVWAYDRFFFCSDGNNAEMIALSFNDIRTMTNSQLTGYEFNKACLVFINNYNIFKNKYKEQKQLDFVNIAEKHNIDIGYHDVGGKVKFKGFVLIEVKDGKCNVKLMTFAQRDDEGNKIKESEDITGNFNIQEPKTDEEKQRKAFYDELVEYVNKDSVMQEILASK